MESNRKIKLCVVSAHSQLLRHQTAEVPSPQSLGGQLVARIPSKAAEQCPLLDRWRIPGTMSNMCPPAATGRALIIFYICTFPLLRSAFLNTALY